MSKTMHFHSPAVCLYLWCVGVILPNCHYTPTEPSVCVRACACNVDCEALKVECFCTCRCTFALHSDQMCRSPRTPDNPKSKGPHKKKRHVVHVRVLITQIGRHALFWWPVSASGVLSCLRGSAWNLIFKPRLAVWPQVSRSTFTSQTSAMRGSSHWSCFQTLWHTRCFSVLLVVSPKLSLFLCVGCYYVQRRTARWCAWWVSAWARASARTGCSSSSVCGAAAGTRPLGVKQQRRFLNERVLFISIVKSEVWCGVVRCGEVWAAPPAGGRLRASTLLRPQRAEAEPRSRKMSITIKVSL